MATAYGSWVATDDFRAKMVYSTSSTNTAVTISATLYIESKAGWSNYGSGTLTVNGSSASGSNKAFSANTTVTVCTKSVTVNKGSSSKSISLSGSVGASYTSSTSKASATVTVPALATYTVSYNANGGSGAPTNQTKTYGTALTLSSTKPTRTGYTFSKWNTKSDGSGTSYKSGGSYTANAAVTLYAIWTANTYTVSYNANGGSGAPANQTKTYGTALTLSSTKPTRTGYTFSKWNTKSDGSGTSYNSGASMSATAITANTTLYAIWTANTYTVSYNANGGSGAPANQTKTYGTALTLSSTKPTRTGYTFSKWNTKSDGSGTSYNSGASMSATAITANTTLYAIWTANTYTVSYNANTEDTVTNMPSAQTKTYDAILVLSNLSPTRTGYSFLGWATSQNAAASYQPGDSFSTNITASTTLYATWRPDTPKVTVRNAYRSDEDGLPLDDGTYAAIDLSWSQALVSDVTITLEVNSISATVGPIHELSGSNTYVLNANLLQNSSYNVVVTVHNDYGNTVVNANIGTATYPVDVHPNGNVSIGGVATSTGPKLEVNGDISASNLSLDSPLSAASGGTGFTSLQSVRNAMGLGDTTGVLPVANGGTGLTSLQAVRNAMGLGDTTGVLPIANGGTGLSASPSMLTNLGSTTAANVLAASPRPGVTGTLGAAHGGTGQTSLQAARNAMGLGNTTGALPIANGGTGKTTAADARKALGAARNVWSSLGSVSGTDSLTIDLTDYNEVLITCRYSTTYLSSIVLPKAGIHASTQWEIYLGGWGNNSTVSNRRAVAKLSRVKFTPVVVTTDQTDRTSSSTWVVYAR